MTWKSTSLLVFVLMAHSYNAQTKVKGEDGEAINAMNSLDCGIKGNTLIKCLAQKYIFYKSLFFLIYVPCLISTICFRLLCTML